MIRMIEGAAFAVLLSATAVAADHLSNSRVVYTGTDARGNAIIVDARRNVPLAQIPPGARVLPLHVWQDRELAQPVRIPHGYRPVWEDDRLNIRRAEQTLRGRSQTNEIWSQTVPRRLIER